jgi:hypothetical protein
MSIFEDPQDLEQVLALMEVAKEVEGLTSYPQEHQHY